MDKKVNAERLLKALSNVDDKYIEEALETSVPAKRAVTTSLRRYSGIIGIAAAALLLLIAGSAVMKIMSSSATAPAPAREENQAVEAEGERNMDACSGALSEEGTENYGVVTDVDSFMVPELTEAAGEDLCVEAEEETVNPMTEVDSLADLAEMAGFDIQVPDSVEGSDSCQYFFYDAQGGLAEVRYLDEDGNVVCTIRKAPGEGDISGCYECFSVNHKIDVDGIGAVDISGNGQQYAVARWSVGDYSYSIVMDQMIPQDAILDLVSQVN